MSRIKYLSPDMYIRCARHSDEDGVLKISKWLFGGMDYLHGQYHVILHSKKRYCAVLIDKDTILGFVCHQVSMLSKMSHRVVKISTIDLQK